MTGARIPRWPAVIGLVVVLLLVVAGYFLVARRCSATPTWKTA